MHTVNFLTHLVENHQALAYLFIFIGLIFEGEIIVISAGILAHLGALDIFTALLFIWGGGVVKMLAGYHLGYLLQKKYNHNRFFRYLEHKVSHIMPHFREKPFWSIFISKFIMGANCIVIIFSGYERIPFRTYLKAELISTAIWAPVMLCLGYFFSHTALSITREIGKFTLIVAGLTIGFFIIDRLIAMLYEYLETIKNQKNGQEK